MRKTKIAGYPIVDADEPLILEIKPMDVVRGQPQEADGCAIVRAARRTFDIVEARVHLSRTYLRTSNGEWLRYITPQAVRTEIISYDRGGSFEPGEYRFPVASPGQRLGVGKPTGPKNGRSKKRTKPHIIRTNIRTWKTE